MRFHTNDQPQRQRSSTSTTAVGRSPRRLFVYSSNAGYARGTLRGLIVGDLRSFTGDDDANMYYSAEMFRKHVFLRFLAKLLGWPSHIRFCNLSASGGPSQLEIRRLISLAERGILRFERATPEEIRAARLDVAAAMPGPLFPASLPDVARRDIGSRKPRFDADGEVIPPRYERNGPKSLAWIGEETADSEAVEPVGLRPITMWKDGFRCVLEGGSWSLSEDGEGEEVEEDPITEWEPLCSPCEWCVSTGATCMHNVP